MTKMLRVVHYLNQFFGQIGAEDKTHTPPLKKEGPVGPGRLFQELLAEGASINAYDPVARHEATKIFGENQIHYCDTLKEAIRDVKGILLLTRWQEFNDLPKMINKLDEQPVVIDKRRMLEKTSVEKYDGIGLGFR